MSATDDVPEIPEPPAASPDRLTTLRPEYLPDEHASYLSYLTNALSNADADAPRNVALTGGYGVGKSSVLQQFAANHPERVVTISLSTISPDVPPKPDPVERGKSSDSQMDDASVSGQIQKSIVKQLLYSRSPANMPDSRFHRIEEFNLRRAFRISIAVLLPVAGVAYLMDWLQRPERFVDWNPIAVAAIWLVAVSLGLVALVLLQRLIHNRVWLKQLSAGPATVDLGGPEQTFFDRWLDEIVYYFQRTDVDVVVFEDLDRFNNAEIFEQLRELNTILNSAEQIQTKPIRFVYAVRDSLFETAPDARPGGVVVEPGTRVAGEDPPSARAKFFDLIIPMVPFATPRTSRDLLRRALRAGEPNSDLDIERLIAAAAPYLQDMRLIANVGNEYRVFAEHVLTPAIDGLRRASLAAMVLYKNLYLGDYEKIRMGTSYLDQLEREARGYVQAASAGIDIEIATIDGELRSMSTTQERADQLVERLTQFVSQSVNALEGGAATQYLVDNTSYSTQQMRIPEFWQKLDDSGLPLTIRLNGTDDRAIDLPQLATILDAPLSPSSWAREDRLPLEQRRAELVLEKSNLRTASFAELIASGRSTTWKGYDDKEHTGDFAEVAKALIGKGLAYALVRGGFIDWNYSLYVSRYIGETTSATALNFAIKYVQAGTYNFAYKLSADQDIPGLLVEVGDSLFMSRSVYNISLFDKFLGDPQLDPALDLLGEGSEVDKSFLDDYLENGNDPGGLVDALASRWPGLLEHLALLLGDPSRATELIDRALGAAKLVGFTSSPELKAIIHASFRDMPLLVQGKVDLDCVRLAEVLDDLGIEVSELNAVATPLRTELAQRGAFELTAENLRTATGGSLALETMIENDSVLRRVLQDFDGYRVILAREGGASVDNEEDLATVLSVLATEDPELVQPAAELVRSGLLVRDITELSEVAWPGAMAAGRIATSVPNLTRYLEKHSADEPLSLAIEASPAGVIEDSDDLEDRRRLANAILGAPGLSTNARVAFVRSLQLDSPLDPTDFDVSDDDLAGELVKAALLPDSASTFQRLDNLSWSTREHYIASAPLFASYLPEIEFTNTDISNLMTSGVPIAIQDRIALDLSSLNTSMEASGARDVIEHASKRGLLFSAASLEVLAEAAPGQSELLSAIAPAQSSIDTAKLIALLARAGGDTAQLGELGNRPLFVPEVPGLIPLLDRLREAQLVNTYSDIPAEGQRRVNMKRPS